MTDQDHAICVELVANGFEIVYVARNRVVTNVRQEAGEAAADLVVENDAKTVSGERTVGVAVERSVTQARSTVEENDGIGFHGDTGRGIEFRIGDARAARQLPVARVVVRIGFGKPRRMGPQDQSVKRGDEEYRADSGRTKTEPSGLQCGPDFGAEPCATPSDNGEEKYGAQGEEPNARKIARPENRE